MEYEFRLSRPLPERTLHNSSVRPTTDKKELASRIGDLVLGLLVDALIMTQQTDRLVADVPFHLFAVSDHLCDLLSLDHGCVVMLDLTEALPHIEWHDNDIGTLQRKPVADLLAIVSILQSHSIGDDDFVLITYES